MLNLRMPSSMFFHETWHVRLRNLLIPCCLVKYWAANLFSLPKASPGNRRLNFRCIADVTRWTLYTYREFH